MNPNETEQAVLELFAKQASAEGLDLEQLTDDQVEEAYGYFVENILPQYLDGDGAQEEDVHGKIASAQNALAFDAFVKAAAAEDVDLNQLSEDDVAELFGAWLVNDVPTYFEEKQASAELEEYAKIAQANLDEMTVMGQHLGEVAADAFLAKVAEGGPMEHMRGIRDTFKLHRDVLAPEGAGALKRNLGAAMGTAKAYPGSTAAAAGLGALGVGAAGYGVHRALKARKAQKEEASKSASAVDDRVLEILAAHGLI